ncbi:tubulin polyglutamylase TTLL5-like isoform X3 [Physella acuta]|uniref:tubulin polyglutamylase TTLL5-like isoform X3 n=1 Tax=Physella acuta TaxID=109671 RepID=UPI0027DBF637|nr:tubulin polyglutamylase TTLL5-like isoform X3 [Physella acuta]
MASLESRGPDSDGNGSLTPSEQSENEERSENDSDYESDDGEDHLEPKGKALNVQWTGYGKRVPIILFNAETILNKRTDFKTVGERYHLAFKFASTDCKIVRNILLSHGFHEVHPNSIDYNLVWSNSHLKPFTLRTMSEFQKINHFPRSYELTRKDRLFKNIQRMQQIKGYKHFDFIPPSYVLPGDYQDFCSSFLKDKGPYIVKPVASSRGRGVFLINHPDQVPLDENVIVSKYISSPLVIDGFKFDVRLYVTVTSYDPLVIYLYEEGLTRFATVKYEKNVKHLRNQCMHLTNYSVNKKSQDYVKNDDPDVEDYGNKWSMGAMLRYLRSEGKDTAALMMRIEDVVIKTILSVESSVATACKMFQSFRGNCFELYGFDILLDENLKPWVLEVNLSPSLACDSPLDLKIKTNMLCDLFSLAGIICHDPMMRTRQQQSKQSTEIAAKLKSRLKGDIDEALAEMLNQIEAARQNMKEADSWLLRRSQRPLSATSSGSKERQTQSGMAGLSSDEIKIVRRVKEEEVRKGGWIRIFPTTDSWETYGSFLQFPTSHNLMLHQRLYGERHKALSKASGSNSITPSRSKSSLQVQTPGKAEQEKFLESYTQALLRAKQYESRLGQLKSKSRRMKKKPAKTKPKRNKLVQGVHEQEDHAEQISEEEAVNDKGKENKETEQKLETKVVNEVKDASAKSVPNEKEEEKSGDVESAELKQAPEPGHRSPSFSPTPVPKYDVVGLLEKGHTLSKVQARTAFAMYLIRVQQRLLSDCGGVLKQEDVDALNEQMDLVLRFLKRAAVNIPQSFRVIVPSRKLPLSDRRRILAKQLGDFVHIYNKETDNLKAVKVRNRIENKKARRTDSSDGMDETKFDQFVYTATEGELEELLTTYTKINRSAAIFLGGDTKPSVNISDSKKEILSKRRENPDITEGTLPAGTLGHGTGDDVTKGRHVSSQAVYDHHTGKLIGAASRPSSVQLRSAPQHSYLSAVSIYSQKLGRPHSATNTGLAHRAGRTIGLRPSTAVTNHQTISNQNKFSTSDPVVDTFNEKAIQEALQRLAQRQQARQYSAHNGSTVLKADYESMSLKHQPNDVKYQESHQPFFIPTPGQLPVHIASSQGSGPHFISMEDQFVRGAQRQPVLSQETSQRAAYLSRPMSQPSNFHLHNANTTFNSFIEDPKQTDHAYSDIDSLLPHGYHMAPFQSRQLHLAQQQAIKQRMMEQSKVMMEQSKANYNALVTQAQSQQTPVDSAYSHIHDICSEDSIAFPGQNHHSKPHIPKPPDNLSHKRTSAHRVHRRADVEENNLHMYSNYMASGYGSQS